MSYQSIIGETPKLARIFGTIAVALAVLLDAGTAARAQPACMPRAELIKQLEVKYAETQTAIGFSDTGRLVELFSTGDGSTWTLVVTTPRGQSCVLITGETWEDRRLVAQGPQV